MITQHLAYNYGRQALVCAAACDAEATNTAIAHEDDCAEIARLAAAAVEAERERIALPLGLILAKHKPSPTDWGRVCRTCWTRGGANASWPCDVFSDLSGIAELLEPVP